MNNDKNEMQETPKSNRELSKSVGESPMDKAERLKEDISRTRSALADDVKALSGRFHADQLKQDTEEIVQHAAGVAREGTRQIARDAKGAAFDSLRYAKDHAIDSITEGVGQVGERAMAAGHSVSDFVATHAVPLTLLGAGAGWLLVSMSHHRRLAGPRLLSRGYDYDRGEPSMWGAARERVGQISDRAGQLTSQAGSAVARSGQRIAERAHDLQAELGERATELRSQVANGASQLGHEAADLGRQAYDGMEWAGTRAVEVSQRNPLAIGMVALAAGAAVAMLLPPTRRENQLLGETRDRLVRGAQRSANELKSSVQQTANDMREVIDEIRQPGSSHV
jgi:hypothetical protein